MVDKLFFLDWVPFPNSDFHPATESKRLNFLHIYLNTNVDRYWKLIISSLSASVFARENNLCGLMGAFRICCSSVSSLSLLGVSSPQ